MNILNEYLIYKVLNIHRNLESVICFYLNNYVNKID